MWAPLPSERVAPNTNQRPHTAVTSSHEHQLRPRPYVVGYSGYIPGLMFQYGRTFGKAAEDCVVTFLKQQETKTTSQQVETERRCKSLPRMKSVRADQTTTRFTYAVDRNYPPLPGYTGHIPNVNRSTLIGRSVASATRREREKMRDAFGLNETIHERSVGRYQEPTLSSRAKQVILIREKSDMERHVKGTTVKTVTETEDSTHETEIISENTERVYEQNRNVNDEVEEFYHMEVDENITREEEMESEDRFARPTEMMTSDHHESEVYETDEVDGLVENTIRVTETLSTSTSRESLRDRDPVRMMLAGKIGCNDCVIMGLRRPTSARPIQREPMVTKDSKPRSISAEASRSTTRSKSATVKKSTSVVTTQKESSMTKPKVPSPSKKAKTPITSQPRGRHRTPTSDEKSGKETPGESKQTIARRTTKSEEKSSSKLIKSTADQVDSTKEKKRSSSAVTTRKTSSTVTVSERKTSAGSVMERKTSTNLSGQSKKESTSGSKKESASPSTTRKLSERVTTQHQTPAKESKKESISATIGQKISGSPTKTTQNQKESKKESSSTVAEKKLSDFSVAGKEISTKQSSDTTKQSIPSSIEKTAPQTAVTEDKSISQVVLGKTSDTASSTSARKISESVVVERKTSTQIVSGSSAVESKVADKKLSDVLMTTGKKEQIESKILPTTSQAASVPSNISSVAPQSLLTTKDPSIGTQPMEEPAMK